MTYYVLLPNGQRFGTADRDLLQRWILEGRVHPHYLLEDASTGARLEARLLPGLSFRPPPGGFSSLSPGADGSGDIRSATLCAIFGFVCCPPLSLVGIVFAVRARDRNHPAAPWMIGLCVASFIGSMLLNSWLYSQLSLFNRF